MNPEITGWLRKLAKNPRRRTPINSSMAPDKNAKVTAGAQ